MRIKNINKYLVTTNKYDDSIVKTFKKMYCKNNTLELTNDTIKTILREFKAILNDDLINILHQTKL